MIRLVLADDHKIIRDGIKSLLTDETGITVTAEASNGEELLELLSRSEADVVLMDINMPQMNGFQAAGLIKERFPSVKMLALSMLDHENYIGQMLDAGVSGYILKNVDRIELVHAIVTIARGEKYLCTEIAFNLLRKLRDLNTGRSHASMDIATGPAQAQFKAKETGSLSKREVEVLQLIAQGFTTGEIAEKLFTSRRTIETHRQNLLDKTQCNNTAALVRYAVSEGLVK